MAEDENKHLTPVWIVYVEGKRLDTDHEGALQKIIINDRLNAIGTASLEFDTSAVKLLDAGVLTMESEVSIHLGYKDDCNLVFSGEITDISVELNEYGHEQVKVECSNCLYKLANSFRSISFESKAVSDVLKEMIEGYSLTAETDSFGSAKDFSVEAQKTDLEYLLEAAKKYGKTVYAYESKIYIKDEVTVASDEVIMEWGKSLISFSGKESLKNQISSCTFVGWDENKCEAISGTAGIDDISVKVGGSKSWKDNSKGAGGKWESTIMAEDLFDNDDAKNRAIGELVNRSFEFQTGIAKGEGNYKVHPGMRVSIKYVGNAFSGEYIADSVVHEFNTSGAFTTEVHVKRNMTE